MCAGLLALSLTPVLPSLPFLRDLPYTSRLPSGSLAAQPSSALPIPPGILGAAVRSFRSGNYAEAQVQLERSLQDDPTLAADANVLRLRVFLALAYHHPDQADRWLRSSRQTEKDPLLLYQLALNRLRFREMDQAALLFDRLLAERPSSATLASLRAYRPEEFRAAFPGLPFACPADRPVPGAPGNPAADRGGWPTRWLDLEEALADSGRAAEVWDSALSPVHLAAAELIRTSFGKAPPSALPGTPSKSQNGDATGDPSSSPARDASGDPAKGEAALLSLLLRPGRASLVRCLGTLPETPAVHTGDLRLLSALLLRYDPSPQAALSVGFRFLEGRDAISPAVEALHALRLSHARLPALQQIAAAGLNDSGRRDLDLRLLVLHQLGRAYQRLGRVKEAAATERMAHLIERYLARGEPFPLQALRDLSGENLRFREGLVLARALAADDTARNRYRLYLEQYDRDNEVAEGQALYRSLYRYD